MNSSKNDKAWEQLFDKYRIKEKIFEDGYIIISSDQIREFREPRLMTKFDHKSHLPNLFETLSILPISRGSYIIGSFDTYFDFKTQEIENVEEIKIPYPAPLESLDFGDITSEAIAINCAFISEIFQDFTGEKVLVKTISGRMSSSCFEFRINNNGQLFKIDVENSQIEIDAGYEGDNSLILIEAKNYLSDNFLIRQLYYPFRLWSKKISKKVRPIFFTYSNGVFHLREFEFTEIDNYNSIKLIKENKYSFLDRSINIEVIQDILNNVSIVKEPHIPFPQANNFERVINLCELIKQKGFLTKEEITREYDFDARQTDYYLNAGMYLGVFDVSKGKCNLTDSGKLLLNISLYERQLGFIRLILKHKAFKDSLEVYFDSGEIPDKDRIVEIMKNSHLFNVKSDITYYRRASTILGWIKWIVDQIEE